MERFWVKTSAALVASFLVLATASIFAAPRAATAQQPGDSLSTLSDNSWRKLDLAASTRYVTPNFVVGATPIADPNPRSRTWSGLVAGGNRVFYFGGGHNSYPGNDVEVFDPVSFRWDQSYKPEVCPYAVISPCSVIYNGPGTSVTTPLGRPYTEHTYQIYAYDPRSNRLFGVLSSGTWAYDLVAKTWTPLAGLHAGNTFSPLGTTGNWHLFGFDAAVGAFHAVVTPGSTAGTYRFEDATRQWVKRGNLPEMGWTQLGSTYGTDRGVHFVYAYGWTHKWWKYDARSGQWTALPDPPAVPDSFDYDSRNRAVVAVNYASAGVSRMMVFDPDASRWMELPTSLTPGPPVSAGGTAAAMSWRYVPSQNVFIFLAGVYNNAGGPTTTWAYRYRREPGAPGPGADTTPPTVTLVAPTPGARISGTVQLSARASDNVGVTAVNFQVDGRDVGAASSVSAPTIVWNSAQVPDGTHTLSAVARDAAGNVTVSAPVTVTVAHVVAGDNKAPSAPTGLSVMVGSTTPPPATPPPTTPPAPGVRLPFASRCSQPGVVRCFGFDSEAEIASFVQPSTSGLTKPTLDTSLKASGGGSLKMTIPSLSPANTSGYFAMNFTPGSLNQVYTGGDPDKGPGYYSVQFGQGEEFYVQWRQRFTPEYINTSYAAIGGGVTGYKQIIVGEGDREGFKATSCTQIDLVVNNGGYRHFPLMYHSCGEKDGHYEGLYDFITPQESGKSAGDWKLQNAVPGCLYSAQTVPPCVGYKANQWMTFQIHVKVGTWYLNDSNYHRDSLVELWIAEEGQPSRLVISKSGYDLANQNPAAKYGKVWLLTFMTGKDPNVPYPETYTWYDELIVSRSRIPDP